MFQRKLSVSLVRRGKSGIPGVLLRLCIGFVHRVTCLETRLPRFLLFNGFQSCRILRSERGNLPLVTPLVGRIHRHLMIVVSFEGHLSALLPGCLLLLR